MRDVSGLTEYLWPHLVFFLRRRHHIACARVYVTDAQGSLPRELAPEPPEPSLVLPIPRPPPSRDGSASSLEAPAAMRQLSRSVLSQPSGLTATRWPSAPAHSRPSTLSGASQLSSPVTSRLQTRHSQVAFEPDPPIPRSVPPETEIHSSKPIPRASSTTPRLCPERQTQPALQDGPN